MKALIIIGIIIGVIIVIIVYSCCVISGISTEREEKIFNEYLVKKQNERTRKKRKTT